MSIKFLIVKFCGYMDSKLVLYNTLTRRKEVFEPLDSGPRGHVCLRSLRSTAIRIWATPVRP